MKWYENVVKVCMGVEPGERVLLITDEALGKEQDLLAGVIEDIGPAELFRWTLPETERPLQTAPPDVLECARTFDVGIQFLAHTTTEEQLYRLSLVKATAGGGVMRFGVGLNIDQAIIDHEAELTAYALEKLLSIPEVIIYGDKDPSNARNRLGVIAFNVKGFDHAFVASVLSYEGGIGVRNGCFCAHPYVKYLLGVGAEDAHEVEKMILNQDRSNVPGAVRMSFGLYNTKEEVDRLCDMLRVVINKNYRGKYIFDKKRGEYYPEGFTMDFTSVFQL